MSKVETPALVIQTERPGLPQSNFELAVNDLRKAFLSPSGEKIEVLKGVTFRASPGQVHAIVGASGAGKSTFLHLLGGLDSADHGTITLAGVSVDRAAPLELAHLRNRRIGFVFQFHHLLPDLTALENVALPLLIARVSWGEATNRASKFLEEIGLSERATHPIGHLSGGEQQRVAVARALINEPLLVLADEPTGNLDADIGEVIGETLRSYCRRRGAIGIVATHNKRLATVCDRTMVLLDGRLNHL